LSEVTARPSFFLSAPLIAPRTECGCQPVAFTTSAIVVPSLRRRSSTSRACFVPDRVDARETVAFGFDLDLVARFDPAALRPWSGDRFAVGAVAGAGCGLIRASSSAPIAARPASVMTSIRRRPSLLFRHAAASCPAGCSASRPLFSRLFRTGLTPPWNLSDFGGGSAAPSSRWAAVDRMTSWVSVSLGMRASFGVLRRGHRDASTTHSPAGRAGRGG
jgi:hypothetical protein